VCYGFGSVKSNEFGSNPTIETDLEETGWGNDQKTELVLKKVKWGRHTYYYETTKIYDINSVERAKSTEKIYYL
jgi:hypothetical protein